MTRRDASYWAGWTRAPVLVLLGVALSGCGGNQNTLHPASHPEHEISTLFWVVFVYPRVARGVYRGARANPQGVMFLVLAALAMTAFYALFIGNIGTAYRMRIQVWAILALLAGWAVARPRTISPVRKTRVTVNPAPAPGAGRPAPAAP